ncbi:MAG: DMT family transporter [Fibrobacterota bacterium]
MSIKSSDRRAYLQLLAASFCWSLSPLFIHYLGRRSIGVISQNGFRYFSASLFLFTVSALLFRDRLRPTPRAIRFLLLTGLSGTLYQMLFAHGLYLIQPGSASLLSQTSVIPVVLLLAAFYPEERRTAQSPLFLLSAGIMLAGVALVIVFKRGADFDFNAGAAFVIAAQVGWTLYTAFIKPALRETHPVVAMAYVSLFIALLHFMIGLPLGALSGITAAPVSVLLVIFFSGIVAIAFPHTLYYAAMRSVGGVLSNTILLISPVLACILSYFIFGETLTPLQIFGGGLLIIGAYLTTHVQYGGKK